MFMFPHYFLLRHTESAPRIDLEKKNMPTTMFTWADMQQLVLMKAIRDASLQLLYYRNGK